MNVSSPSPILVLGKSHLKEWLALQDTHTYSKCFLIVSRVIQKEHIPRIWGLENHGPMDIIQVAQETHKK